MPPLLVDAEQTLPRFCGLCRPIGDHPRLSTDTGQCETGANPARVFSTQSARTQLVTDRLPGCKKKRSDVLYPRPSQLTYDFGCLRVSAFAVLGKDDRTIDRDVEDAVAALAKFRFYAQRFRYLGCQTGGPGQIISLAAISDGDVHGFGYQKSGLCAA